MLRDDIADELESYSRWAMDKCIAFDAGEITDEDLPFICGEKCEMLDKAAREIKALRKKIAGIEKVLAT